MTDKNQFIGLTAIAHEMRTDIFEAFVGKVGEMAALDRKLAAVDQTILRTSHEAEVTHLISYRVLLKQSIEDLKAVTEAFTKAWQDTQAQVDAVIIERMDAAAMKTVTVDGVGKLTRSVRRNYKVGDIKELSDDLQARAVNGEDLQPYLDLFGITLGVSKLDEMLDDGVTPLKGVESSSSASLRFTKAK